MLPPRGWLTLPRCAPPLDIPVPILPSTPAAVLLSAMFLGEKPTLPVVLALMPIIGGVVLASTSELSFTWKGFLSGEPAAQSPRGMVAEVRLSPGQRSP